MKRRDVLAATGLGLAGAAGAWYLFGQQGLGDATIYHPGNLTMSDGDVRVRTQTTPESDAEPLSFPTNGDFPEDDDPADGRPPAFPDPPAAPDADPSTFPTTDTNDETVRLVPIDVAIAWYYRGEAHFVDARGLDQYANAHVYGAVNSAAQADSSGGGVAGWSTDDRIVTYCGCPHHLSSLRGAGFAKAGYDRVYAIDEGFGEWADRGYPMAGTAFESSGATGGDETDAAADVEAYVLEGVVDPQYAGEYAFARTDGNREAAPIRDDGSFALHVRFPGATDATRVEVSTPEFAVTRPLGELASGTITGE